jgi:hypothetical protein
MHPHSSYDALKDICLIYCLVLYKMIFLVQIPKSVKNNSTIKKVAKNLQLRMSRVQTDIALEIENKARNKLGKEKKTELWTSTCSPS